MQVDKSNISMGFPECRGSVQRFPCYAEIKLDGELNWYNNGMLANKSGKTRKNCPITEELQAYTEDKVLIGELYYNGGKQGALYDLLRNHASDDLRYCVFDMITSGTYEERRELLINTLVETEHVKIAPTWYVEDKEELDRIRDSVYANGFEGLVIKQPNGRYVTGPCEWIKLKKKDRSNFKIHYIDPNQERIEVSVPVPNGQPRVVGVKVANKYKPRLNVYDTVTIEHQGILSAGGLRHPVYIPKEKGGVI